MKKELYYFLGDEEHDDDYTYEVDYDEVYDFIVEQFDNEYHVGRNTARSIIDDFDLWEQLEEYYDEAIKDNWFDEAMEQRDDDIAYQDKYSYYGISESDFH